MDKISKYVLMAVLLLLSVGLVLDRVNNPPVDDRQADSLVKRVYKVFAIWFVDRTMQEEPPAAEPTKTRRDEIKALQMARQYQTLPIVQPSELMTRDGGELDHSRGW